MTHDEIIKKCNNYKNINHDSILRHYYNGIGNLNNLTNPDTYQPSGQYSSAEYIITRYSIKLDKYLNKKSKVFPNFFFKEELDDHEFNYYIHILYRSYLVSNDTSLIYNYIGICNKCGIKIISEHGGRTVYMDKKVMCAENLMVEALG